MQPLNNTFTFKIVSSIILFLLLCNCKEIKNLPDPLEAGWNNEVVCEVLEDNDKVRTLKCTFPPGVGHERHYHKSHFGYTLAGSTFRIKDTSGTREVNIPTGYSFYNEKVDWHEVLNIGDSTAVFLIVEPKS
ncbi:cupin domain-containing protein [Psychroserpens sp.]|uniref:cupin domain-containing protein n=1 Tax=Psychroserpens sp. TaxID=2020870 RepID=UPI002B278172|nr:cupin domain-containing protein [Psychroserpens sp.]